MRDPSIDKRTLSDVRHVRAIKSNTTSTRAKNQRSTIRITPRKRIRRTKLYDNKIPAVPKRTMHAVIRNHNKIKKDRPTIESLTKRIKKSLFKPKHTLVSHGRVYNVCKTCPSYHRKRLRTLNSKI